MHFLHELVRDLVEAELASTLDEDDLVAQRAEDGRVEERTDTVEEELLIDVDEIGIGGDDRADADKLLHATLLSQTTHLTVKVSGSHAALLNIAEDERAATTFVVGTAVHEVEGDVERVDIRVVRVVDERAAVTAFLDLETHSDGLELAHALTELVGIDTEAQGDKRRDDGVLNAGVVDERNRETADNILRNIIIYIGDGRCRLTFLD